MRPQALATTASPATTSPGRSRAGASSTGRLQTEHDRGDGETHRWLPANIPPGEETTLVHGDYRLDNMIFHRREPRILAVIDWELSTLGHPLADFSYHVMLWRVEAGEIRGLADSTSAPRHPDGSAVRRQLLPPHRARDESSRACGNSAWRTTCSASPASARGSCGGWSRARPPAATPARRARGARDRRTRLAAGR